MDKRYIKIKNKNSEVVIDSIGAQIVSYKINGVEIMFQGAINPQENQWAGTAKNLFPNPGPVADKSSNPVIIEGEENGRSGKYTKYTHNSGVYFMKQHGFVQDKPFEVQGKGNDWCMLSTRADDKTYLQFPFEFKYDMLISIDENGLGYQATAKNLDNKPMVSGLGWHPAFKLHKGCKNYVVVFRNLKINDGKNIPEENKEYSAEEVVNSDSAITFDGIEEADVEILYINDKGERIPYLKMHTNEPNFLLWSRAKENESQEDFICLEPWNTKSKQISKLTSQDKTRTLSESGTVILEPGEENFLIVPIKIDEEYIKMLQKENSEEIES